MRYSCILFFAVINTSQTQTMFNHFVKHFPSPQPTQQTGKTYSSPPPAVLSPWLPPGSGPSANHNEALMSWCLQWLLYSLPWKKWRRNSPRPFFFKHPETMALFCHQKYMRVVWVGGYIMFEKMYLR